MGLICSYGLKFGGSTPCLRSNGSRVMNRATPVGLIAKTHRRRRPLEIEKASDRRYFMGVRCADIRTEHWLHGVGHSWVTTLT